MARFALSVVSVCVLLLWSASLAGSDADDLRDKAKVILKEAAALAEKGNKEEAAQLEAKARELLELAERRDHGQKHGEKPAGPSPKIEMLEAHLKNLLVKQQAMENKASKADLAELQAQIADTKATLEKLRLEQKHHPDAFATKPENLDAAIHRLKHLRTAAEHLRAAGALELSQHVNEQAEQMEREVHQEQERRARSSAEHDGSIPAQIEEMRREMQRLRAEVEELRRQVKEK